MSPPTDKRIDSARRSYYVFWVLLALLVGVGAWVLFWPHGTREEVVDEGAARQTPERGVRSITLYFGDAQARSLIQERRDVVLGGSLEESVEMAVRALVLGPEQDGSSPVLPREARLTQAFFADEEATLYLDFNTALVTQHPGGSAAEYYTLRAIVRTLATNFPAVRRVQILVDGQPIDSLAGHFDTSQPLDIASWK